MRSQRETDALETWFQSIWESRRQHRRDSIITMQRCSGSAAAFPQLSDLKQFSKALPRPSSPSSGLLQLSVCRPERCYLGNGRYRRTDVRAITGHDKCGYENVVFYPGDDASEPLEKLSERKQGAAIEYLAPGPP
jgi:hypothetical protein